MSSAPFVRRWIDRARTERAAPSPVPAQVPPPRQPERESTDWGAWRTFVSAIMALAIALVLALYSSSAAAAGQIRLAASSAIAALILAGWVAFTVVPVLARRTSVRWFAVHLDYRVTREGLVYLLGVLVVAIAALNTGNNLLFMMLASLLAGILVSGVTSQLVLRDVELRLELPEHIFAGRPVIALAELINHKQALPSFSLRLVGATAKTAAKSTKGKPATKSVPKGANDILTAPVYFPYIPHKQAVQQRVELLFPRRGIYRQDALGLQTRFPFGFLEKTRSVDSRLQAVVYPSVEPTSDFQEILPEMVGELESFLRGRGSDLYSIRDYQTTDTSRHVDWKASAKTGALQVREFARDDERRVLLVLDPTATESASASATGPIAVGASRTPLFDRGVSLCASLAWHFYGVNSLLMFRTAGFETPMVHASENIYDILGYLATAAPSSDEAGLALLDSLADSPHVFKIIVTAQPRGSVPADLWNSSYIVFLNS